MSWCHLRPLDGTVTSAAHATASDNLLVKSIMIFSRNPEWEEATTGKSVCLLNRIWKS